MSRSGTDDNTSPSRNPMRNTGDRRRTNDRSQPASGREGDTGPENGPSTAQRVVGAVAHGVDDFARHFTVGNNDEGDRSNPLQGSTLPVDFITHSKVYRTVNGILETGPMEVAGGLEQGAEKILEKLFTGGADLIAGRNKKPTNGADPEVPNTPNLVAKNGRGRGGPSRGGMGGPPTGGGTLPA